ncbi:MAG: hypothetical protein J6K61_01820 [Clostridia bacterium]|nr:hypothetical protein [Clostridia bacterium]
MKNVTYVSAAEPRKIWKLSGILVALGCVAALFLSLGIGNRLVMQLFAVFSFVAAIYFWYAYIATSYLYEVGEEDKEIFFLVYKQQGKKSILQAKLALSSLRDMVKTDSQRPLSSSLYQKKYRYSAAFFPEEYTALLFEEDGAIIALEICADEAFLSLFSPFLPKSNEPNEEITSPFDS